MSWHHSQHELSFTCIRAKQLYDRRCGQHGPSKITTCWPVACCAPSMAGLQTRLGRPYCQDWVHKRVQHFIAFLSSRPTAIADSQSWDIPVESSNLLFRSLRGCVAVCKLSLDPTPWKSSGFGWVASGRLKSENLHCDNAACFTFTAPSNLPCSPIRESMMLISFCRHLPVVSFLEGQLDAPGGAFDLWQL